MFETDQKETIMTEQSLPRRISNLSVAILKTLSETTTGMSLEEIRNAIADFESSRVTKQIYNLKNKGMVGDAKKGTASAVKITPFGRTVIKHLDEVIVFEVDEEKPKRKSPTKKSMPTPQPDPLPDIDLSEVGHQFADLASAMLGEVNRYRTILQDVRDHHIAMVERIDKILESNKKNKETAEL